MTISTFKKSPLSNQEHNNSKNYNLSPENSSYTEFIKNLEEKSLEKVHNENRKDDNFVKNFIPVTILYLIDSKCIKGNGHSSLLFLDKNGKGVYYNTSDLRDILGVIKGNDVGYVIDRKVLQYDKVKYLLNIGKIPLQNKKKESKGVFRYDKFISIPVHSFIQGRIALRKADQMYYNPGTYNLYERNCNHVTQEVLATIGKNFSSTKGSSKLVIERFKLFVEALKHFDIDNAQKILNKTHSDLFETGVLPNGAYARGVKIAEQKKYRYGKLPIENLSDLTRKPAFVFDPVIENLDYIINSINNKNNSHNTSNDLTKPIVRELKTKIASNDICGIYNIINKNFSLKINKPLLSTIVNLYNRDNNKLNTSQRNIFERYISKTRSDLQNLQDICTDIPLTKKSHCIEMCNL